jgi:hypothetical protein
MGEAGQHDPDEEDRDHPGHPAGQAALLHTGGVAVAAEVEDVLQHGEAGRGQSTVDNPVHHAGERLGAEQEEQQRTERLQRLLDERRGGRRDERDRKVQQLDGGLVEHERAAGRDGRAPAQAGGEVADRLRLVAVQPEEAGDQHGYRDERADRADHQRGDPDVESQVDQRGDADQRHHHHDGDQ